MCPLIQIDANGVEQRLNHGVVFTKDKPLHDAAEMWLHTLEIPMPKYINVPNIGTCHKDMFNNRTSSFSNKQFKD